MVMRQVETRFVSGHGFSAVSKEKQQKQALAAAVQQTAPAAEAVQEDGLGGIAEAKP
jgi:hypothetical protein